MSILDKPVFSKSRYCDKVGVVRANGQYGLVACKPLLMDEPIFEINGEYTPHPSKYSVQIARQLHVDIITDMSTEDILDHCYWRFMNHSCSPTAYIRNCMVIALRHISPWEEITFNYNTMEYDLAEPFECRCNSPSCMGTIKGYKYLSMEERIRLLPFTAPHLA